MSIFNELLPKISEISRAYTKNFNDDLKASLEALDKIEEEFYNGRGKARDKNQKDKNMTTLQSITEDDGEPTKTANLKPNGRLSNQSNEKISKQKSKEDPSKIEDAKLKENNDKPRGTAKKRSKGEVDGISSPEQDKRQKRNASVRAQTIITKQVNVSLNQKLRREDTVVETKGNTQKNDEGKENIDPTMIIEIKQEKESLPPAEPMDMESLPINVEVKQEMNKDEFAMPPPTAPVPKHRKNAAKDKDKTADDSTDEESTGRQRNTRTKKQTDPMPPPPVPGLRSTRASSRASARKPVDEESIIQAQPEARPKRTRGRKKLSKSSSTTEPASETSDIRPSTPVSPPEKPRPKRTRRGQKAAKKSADRSTATQDQEPTKPKSPVLKEERLSITAETNSPILTTKSNHKNDTSKTKLQNKEVKKGLAKDTGKSEELENEREKMDQTRVINKDAEMDQTRVINKDAEMDQTMVLTNGVYNHAPVTPKNVRNMNETVVLGARNRETVVIDKQNVIMDATVVIEKEVTEQNVTDDNSILTDDSSSNEPHTPPKQDLPSAQPTSAVKEKVQQFEELASRVTRTKTRAMAKRDESTETQTPPDNVSKAILDAETLKKMNSLIFNGKPPQTSSSACKPRSNIPTIKAQAPGSTSKLSALCRARDMAEESLAKSEKEDARKKKEAMLEAKRELQRKKREEKMAAAAAVRLAAERERQAHAQAAERERSEKLAQVSTNRNLKLKEVERKKQEAARKAAETEERRRAEEVLRQQRRAEEQKRLEANRKKQMEEHEAMKKEAAIMAKEIEKRQKEYIEKQKKKLEWVKSDTPRKTPGTPGYHIEPVYMQDGFQYLNSDEEEEVTFTPPPWSLVKARRQPLQIQCSIQQQHIDRLFSVQVHSPDLRSIFPNIERSRLKRTSSAVWRTPPHPRMSAVTE